MRCASILAAAMVCFAAAGARAQPDDADALIKQGLDLRRRHRDAEALEDFRRAYASRGTARALAQIAFAEQALGRWVDAEADLQKAMAARDDAWIARNMPVLERGLAGIQGHLGWIEISADVTAADLRINGVDVGTGPLPRRVRVEAGSVDVELLAPGYEPARRITSVDAGGSGHETIHLVPVALPPPEPVPATGAPPAHAPPTTASPSAVPPPEPRRADAALRNAGLVVLGAGALSLGMGAYFGVRTLSTKGQRDSVCPGQTCPPEGVVLDQQARSEALASTAWFAAGILAAGAGAVLVWVSRSGAHPAPVTALRVGPAVGADRAGVVLGGRW